MSNQPIWQMVQECARELTKAGNIPFNRKDIIACIKRRSSRCDENSINPVIQGVTDKCRAYDAIHIKKEHGDKVRTIMLYAKSNSGISIAQAERISYPFHVFIGLPTDEIGAELIDRLIQEISTFLDR